MNKLRETKEYSNWNKCILCLQKAKEAFHDFVAKTWNDEISNWKDVSKDDIRQFVEHVNQKTATIRFQKNRSQSNVKATWQCKCYSDQCETIFGNLLKLQQSPSSELIVWKCTKPVSFNEPQKIQEADASKSKTVIFREGHRYFMWKINEQLSVEVRDNRYDSEQWSPKPVLKEDDEVLYHWSLASMFMCKEANNIQCPSPKDTDISMFFKMMKNCKLFNTKENFRYDQILARRNFLMHSSTLQVSKEEMDSTFGEIKALLELFPQIPDCVKAIEEINELYNEELVITPVASEDVIEIGMEKALTLRLDGLRVDIKLAESTQSDTCLLKDMETQTEEYRKQLRKYKSFDFDIGKHHDSKDETVTSSEKRRNSQKTEDKKHKELISGHAKGVVSQYTRTTGWKGSAEATDAMKDGSGGIQRIVRIIRRNSTCSAHISLQCQKDRTTCLITDLCRLEDGRLIAVDNANSCLKLFSQRRKIYQTAHIGGDIYGVCEVSRNALAVTLKTEERILFVSVIRKIKTERFITVGEPCYTIAYRDGLLFVCCFHSLFTTHGSVRSFDMNGTEIWHFDLNGYLPMRICLLEKLNQRIFVSAYINDIDKSRLLVIDKSTNSLCNSAMQYFNVYDMCSYGRENLGILVSISNRNCVLKVQTSACETVKEIELPGLNPSHTMRIKYDASLQILIVSSGSEVSFYVVEI